MPLRPKNGNESMVFLRRESNKNQKHKINKANFHPSIKKSRAEWPPAEKYASHTRTTVQHDIIYWWMYKELTNGVAGEL
jgi:hypothetical protein